MLVADNEVQQGSNLGPTELSSHAKVEELSWGFNIHFFSIFILAELSPLIFLCRSKSFLGPVESLKRPESN